MQNKYFIGIELPINLQKSVDFLRRVYYPYGYKNVPAHITLAGPFMLSEKEKNMSKKVKQIVEMHKQIDVNVVRFGTFMGDKAVFYAGIEQALPLISLHQELYRLLHEVYQYQYPLNRNYTPHITIANQLTLAQLENIIVATAGYDLSQSFTVKQVSLFGKQVGRPYQVFERYSLDKNKDLRYHPEADLGNGQLKASTSAT